ncbi:MAG: hypothetical protein IJB79_06095 [Candidatus Gastranaerophilales bacterium]|nr:hypothetical protein [Candidatus Gastranaerophilales bacterium]
MGEKFNLIKYHTNFCDNLSAYAYSEILSQKTGIKCYYENNTISRNMLEKQMSHLDLELNFLSINRVKEISKKANELNNIYLNKKISKKHSHYINTGMFNINDISYLSNEIINKLQFKNTDFLINHDILEEISTTNSIGIYIDKNDDIDFDFINRALKRLNKYIKQPKVFIFSSNSKLKNQDLYLNYKIINIDDFKEEFTLLKSCKHKIILNTKNSYSEGFWAAVFNQKEYCLNVYDKKIKVKRKLKNWIGV